jgi:hypothetical protein
VKEKGRELLDWQQIESIPQNGGVINQRTAELIKRSLAAGCTLSVALSQVTKNLRSQFGVEAILKLIYSVPGSILEQHLKLAQ